MTLAIQRERTPEGFFVRLSGVITPRNAAAIVEAITSTPDHSIVLDLSDLGSLDEDGLRTLGEARQRIARDGRSMIVIGASDAVREAIRSAEPSWSPETVEQPGSGLRSRRH